MSEEEQLRQRLGAIILRGGPKAEKARGLLAKLPTVDADAMARSEGGMPAAPSMDDSSPSGPIAQPNDIQRLTGQPRTRYEVDPNTIGAPGAVPPLGESGSGEPGMRVASDPNNPFQHDPLAAEIGQTMMLAPLFSVGGRMLGRGAQGIAESRGGMARELMDTEGRGAAFSAPAAPPSVPITEAAGADVAAARARAASLGAPDPAVIEAEKALQFHLFPSSHSHSIGLALSDLAKQNLSAAAGAISPAARAVRAGVSSLTTPRAALLMQGIPRVLNQFGPGGEQ